MSSTTKYQLSLPFVLLPASPALVALHATRARILHPTESAFLDSTHCVKCGSYLDGKVFPIKRQKSSKGLKVMTRTCGACGFGHKISMDRGNASSFPRTRKSRTATSVPADLLPEVKSQTSAVEHPSNLQPSPPAFSSNLRTALPNPTASSSQPTTPVRSKSRPKKKSGLQDMLSRNREKEAKARQEKHEGQGGLAAFLSGL